MAMAYEGIRIIDFTQLQQGPAGIQVLADFGAEVIKVEQIDSGDIGRAQYPQRADTSTWWMSNNRNKKSLSLDLKKPEAKAIIYKLAESADVVASNFRPGVMERLGFGFDDLKKINPRIIVAYASGYGQTGPYVHKRGQDLIGQALGGLMAMTGEAGGPPAAAGTSVIDNLAAMLFAQGIMIALAARERTGEGQVVDSCLLNAGVEIHHQEATAYLNTDERYLRPRRGLNRPKSGPLYASYQTRDAKWLFMVGAFRVSKPWEQVCTALGIDSSIASDIRFQGRNGLLAHEAEVQAILQEAFQKLTREEAIRLLEEQDILCGPIYEDPEVFTDPQVLHNEMVIECDHPTVGKLRLIGFPVKLSGTPATLRMPPPLVGQHNEEILTSLGYAEQTIRELQQRGVVGSENLKMKALAASLGHIAKPSPV